MTKVVIWPFQLIIKVTRDTPQHSYLIFLNLRIFMQTIEYDFSNLKQNLR